MRVVGWRGVEEGEGEGEGEEEEGGGGEEADLMLVMAAAARAKHQATMFLYSASRGGGLPPPYAIPTASSWAALNDGGIGRDAIRPNSEIRLWPSSSNASSAKRARPSSASQARDQTNTDSSMFGAKDLLRARPASATGHRPASATGHRPARPASASGHRPARPASAAGHRPASATGHRPASATGHRPASASKKGFRPGSPGGGSVYVWGQPSTRFNPRSKNGHTYGKVAVSVRPPFGSAVERFREGGVTRGELWAELGSSKDVPQQGQKDIQSYLGKTPPNRVGIWHSEILNPRP